MIQEVVMKLFAGLKADTDQSRNLLFSLALTGLILLVEVVAGFLTNSLALLSDAVHVLTDMVSLGLAFFAILLSALPATDTRTYGWHRTEVFAALINGVTLVVISGVIIFEAVHRISAPQPVKSVGMLAAASFGLVMNLFVVHRLHGHDEHDLNIRSAFLHVVGDVLISVGVIVGAVIIYYTDWYLVDPILSVVFSLVILRGAVNVLYEASHILLEGVPKGLDINAVVDEIKKTAHVVDVHRLHVWSICPSISALSAHIMIDSGYQGERKKIIDDINCRLISCFQINHSTLQLEKGACEFNNLVCDLVHCERRLAHIHPHGHAHEEEH
ncbi:MAG: cation diffusion facilitator family transporter, partial [Nitrospirota bacterium]